MKKIFQYISIVCAIGALITLTNCSSNEPSVSEVMTNKLIAHPWKLSIATVDGVDKTAIYGGLNITFTNTGYTATNGLPVWPATGTWTFKDGNAKSIIRKEDGLEIEIAEASQSTLKLKFTWNKNTFSSGRTESINGLHVFTFIQ